jgi:CSLREA domain-containing protein
MFSLAMSAASALPIPAAAANIVVSTTADDVMVNGNCTLREAVIAANSDARVDACPAGSGADTIVLRAGIYRLSLLGNAEDASLTGDLDVHTAMTISATSAAVTFIEGGTSDNGLLRDRVIHVSAPGNLTLSRVTIRGGYCTFGAGIYNEGVMQVVDGHVEDNISSWLSELCLGGSTATGLGGAGIVNGSMGRLTVLRSILSRNYAFGTSDDPQGSEFPAGGLLNHGLATISGSTLTSNFAAMGGAVVNWGQLRIDSSRISTNDSRFRAAAVWNLGDASFVSTTVDTNVGGDVILNGLDGRAALLTILNSTISGNFSYYGSASVNNRAGNVSVVASTIAGNSAAFPGAAGIGGPGRTEVADSIVFNPPNDWGPNGDCEFPIVSGGNNIAGDDSCGLSEEQGDQPNTDPLLGPLANNGGPTPTHALLGGSPAIEHIPVSQCVVATDQRGVARPQLPKPAACDVGAYELSPAGDIELIAKDVAQLWSVSQARRLTLLQSLKQAIKAVHDRDAAGACSALETFSTIVSAYASDGSLTAAQAAALLAGAERARGIICQD